MRTFIHTISALLLLALLAAPAVAQDIIDLQITSEGLRRVSESTDLILDDPLLGEMLLPDEEAFPSEDLITPEGGDISISSRFEVKDSQRSGVLTPAYRINERFTVKATLPLIWKRTLSYHGRDAEGSGLGDLALDVAYDWPDPIKEGALKLAVQVKLPTGDSEYLDGDLLVPLGTGSTDYTIMANYSRQVAAWGFVGGAFLRKNSVNEKTVQLVETDSSPERITTTKYELTAGTQLGLAAHFRKQLDGPWNVYAGLSFLRIADGESTYKTTDNQGSPTEAGSYPNPTGMRLIDLSLGASYALGPIRPYLGIRLPVISSYSEDATDDDRSMAFVLQFTYKPRMGNHG